MGSTSKCRLAAALIAAAGLSGLAATPAKADIGDFVGQWVNTDRDTSGITRIEVTRRGPALDIHVYGQCQPRDCDWGTVRADIYAADPSGDPVRDATAISARFNAGFAQKFVILHEARGDQLSFDVYTNFSDRSRRADYVMQGRLRPAGFGRGPGRGFGGPGGSGGPGAPAGPGPGRDFGGRGRGPDAAPPLAEDCSPFETATVLLLNTGGSWKLMDRGRPIADFGDNRGEALRAFDTIKKYGFSSQCFIGGGATPAMTYWKAGDDVPGGAPMPGEDCIAFDSQTADVQRVQGSWKIVDRGRFLADFGNNRADADRALDVIRNYDLARQCFVGRPNPSMSYWLSR